LPAESEELVRHAARQLSPEQTARWLKAYWTGNRWPCTPWPWSAGRCGRPILALPSPGPRTRATALATVALARRAAGLPDQGELTEARFLDPDADLIAEAMGTSQAQGV
jgi:hypothetical protein